MRGTFRWHFLSDFSGEFSDDFGGLFPVDWRGIFRAVHPTPSRIFHVSAISQSSPVILFPWTDPEPSSPSLLPVRDVRSRRFSCTYLWSSCCESGPVVVYDASDRRCRINRCRIVKPSRCFFFPMFSYTKLNNTIFINYCSSVKISGGKRRR